MDIQREPPRIAGPITHPKVPRENLPADAWDAHAHIFGPVSKFPFAPGRGYTPPDAPVEAYIALLDHLGFARGLLVQGNAHGYDNRVLLDALARFPQRLRGVAITDTRIAPAALHDWHRGCAVYGFICFRKLAGPAMCEASASTSLKSFDARCVSSAGSCRCSATGG